MGKTCVECFGENVSVITTDGATHVTCRDCGHDYFVDMNKTGRVYLRNLTDFDLAEICAGGCCMQKDYCEGEYNECLKCWLHFISTNFIPTERRASVFNPGVDLDQLELDLSLLSGKLPRISSSTVIEHFCNEDCAHHIDIVRAVERAFDVHPYTFDDYHTYNGYDEGVAADYEYDEEEYCSFCRLHNSDVIDEAIARLEQRIMQIRETMKEGKHDE